MSRSSRASLSARAARVTRKRSHCFAPQPGRNQTQHEAAVLLTPVFEVGADLATDAPHAHPLPTMPWRDLLTHQAGRVVVEDHGFFRLACVERGHPAAP